MTRMQELDLLIAVNGRVPGSGRKRLDLGRSESLERHAAKMRERNAEYISKRCLALAAWARKKRGGVMFVTDLPGRI